MNYFEVFYWVAVADGVKSFFDWFSDIFTIFSILTLGMFLVFVGIYNDTSQSHTEKDEEQLRYWIVNTRKVFIWCIILMTITWAGYVFTPSKKDALIIVAGGTVGNFITKDTGASRLPSEVIQLLRVKMKSEIEELQNPLTSVSDTLAEKSKEELIELLKNKK